MYPKIKTRVLNYSRLNLGIENDVYPYNFLFISAMDGKSNREVLEIFNMNKNVIPRFLILNPPPICQLFPIFSIQILILSNLY